MEQVRRDGIIHMGGSFEVSRQESKLLTCITKFHLSCCTFMKEFHFFDLNTAGTKNKEQIESEYKVRRDYPRKWGRLVGEEVNLKRYNLDIVHRDVCDKWKHIGVERKGEPYKYTGHGDGHFVSREMHKTLLATCRCGREKTGVHISKCLRRPKNVYLPDVENKWTPSEPKPNCTRFKGERIKLPLPGLSSEVVGWPQNRFAEWELSTRYISPKYTMPGYKIDSQPYKSIALG